MSYNIGAEEIVNFLRDNGILVSLNDCNILIAAYDGDKDNKLDFKEFEKLILTNHHPLKMRAYGRPEQYIGYKDKLQFDVEYELSRLMKQEIDKLKDLNFEKTLIK